MTPWLIPTARATEWRGLAAAIPIAVVASWTAAHAESQPAFVVPIIVATTASAAVLSMHDAARSLLRAVSSPTTRLVHRFALVAPLTTLIVIVQNALTQTWLDSQPAAADVAQATLALFTTALAAQVIGCRRDERWPVTQLAAGIPILWVLAETWIGTPHDIKILTWWHAQPLTVVAITLAIAGCASRGQAA